MTEARRLTMGTEVRAIALGGERISMSVTPVIVALGVIVAGVERITGGRYRTCVEGVGSSRSRREWGQVISWPVRTW